VLQIAACVRCALREALSSRSVSVIVNAMRSLGIAILGLISCSLGCGGGSDAGASDTDAAVQHRGMKDAGAQGGAGQYAGSGSGGKAASSGSGGRTGSAQHDAGAMQSAPDAAAHDAAMPMMKPDPLTPDCDGDTCHYVLAGASGNADGSDWTNAWTALPDTLQRGHTYFVGDGEYPGYQFDDAADGETPIVVVRATAATHGTDAGWRAAHADGVAQFAPIEIMSPYVVFSGQVAHGFVVRGDFQSTAVQIGADFVDVENIEVDGAFGQGADGKHNAGACTGIDVGKTTGVVIANCEIHDVADDGVSISDATSLSFTHNVVHALHACGTDGDCGPCYNGHSDGIEAYHVSQSTFDRNFIYDVRSTSTFFFGNWADSLGNGPSDYCSQITLTNNIFYAPEVGLVAYIQDVDGVDVFDNVFWGTHQGGYGGLSIGQHVKGLRLYSNVILSINTDHVMGMFDPAEHHGDYNLFGISLGQWTESGHDVVALDPGFVGIPDADGAAVKDPKPEDFALDADSMCIGAGDPDRTLPLPGRDFFQRARDTMPDIGAIERQ
jgi:hypothetical protein